MNILKEIVNMVWGVATTACFLFTGVIVALYYAGNIGILQLGKHLVLISINY